MKTATIRKKTAFYMMKEIGYNILIFIVLLIFSACHSEQEKHKDGFDIIGAWELIRIEYPNGEVRNFDVGTYTRCKIFDADSTYYSIELFTDGDDVTIIPHEMARFSLSADSTYVENGRRTPFQIIDDSTFTTVWDGYLEVMRKCPTITESRKKEIREFVRIALTEGKEDSDRLTDYMLSTSERKLQSRSERYMFAALLLLLVVAILVWYVWQMRKRKHEIENQLRELQKIQNLRPAPVNDAMREVEAEFYQSEYDISLRKKIEAGCNFKFEDWEELEQRLKVIYPAFSAALYQLLGMSKTEYQVCLLIKIRTTPNEIAGVLKREPSSISSMRGRLYHKYFDKKGGAKE